MVNNQIYIRIGRPSRYKPTPYQQALLGQRKQPNPIKIFIIKWGLVLGFLYFFTDDIIRFIFGLIL